jgi:hypothetical protein
MTASASRATRPVRNIGTGSGARRCAQHQWEIARVHGYGDSFTHVGSVGVLLGAVGVPERTAARQLRQLEGVVGL